jgi:RNA-binding protein 26
MNLDENSLKLLSDYLFKILTPITDANPEALVKYVKALLLKSTKIDHEFRHYMIEKLEDFLKRETEKFVDHILGVMKDAGNQTLFQQKLRQLLDSENSSRPSMNDSRRDTESKEKETPPDTSKDIQSQPHHEAPLTSYSSNEKQRSRTPSPSETERQHTNSPSRRYPGRRRERERERERDRERDRDKERDRSRDKEKEPVRERPRERERERERDRERERERERDRSPEERPAKRQRRESSSPSPSGQRYSDGEDERRKTFDTRRTEDTSSQSQHIFISEGESRVRSGQRRGGGGGQRRVRGRGRGLNRPIICRDFAEKGMCLRGDKCPYWHGTDVVALKTHPPNPQPFNLIVPPNYPPKIPIYPTVPYVPGVPSELPMGPVIAGYSVPDSRRLSAPSSADLFRNMPLANLPSEKEEDASLVVVDARNSSDVVATKTQGERSERRRFYRPRGGHRTRSEKRDTAKPTGSSQPLNQETTTIDVVNIPFELNTIDKLNEHFKKFGRIINIQVMPDKGKAQIQFSDKSEARAAVKSTEAVLNNRFIKIYWAREQKEADVTEQSKAAAEVKSETSKVTTTSQSTVPQDTNVPRPVQTQLTSEEYEKKKQEKIAIKKALEEKKRELQKQQLLFIKKQRDLLDNLMQLSKKENLSKEEKENLLNQIQIVSEKLKAAIQEQQKLVQPELTTVTPRSPSTSPPPPPVNIPPKSALSWIAPKESSFLSSSAAPSIFTVEPVSTTPTSSLSSLQSNSTVSVDNSTMTATATFSSDSTAPKSSLSLSTPSPAPTSRGNDPNVETLKQKVESLRQEVKELGIVPSATVSSVSRPFSFSKRRRPWRGIGRASGRGRGHPPVNPLVLDRRTTQICVHNLPADIREIGILTEHFKAFGEVQSVTLHDADAIIKMASRKSAEMAISKGLILRDHKLHMSWYEPSSKAQQQDQQSLVASTVQTSEQTGGEPLVSEGVVEEVIPSNGWDSGAMLYFGDSEDEIDRSWKHSTISRNNQSQ